MCLCVCVFNVYAVPGEDGEVTPDPGGGDQSSAQSSDVPYIPDPPAEGGGDQSSAQSSDVPYIPESNNDNSSYDGGGGGYDGGGDNQTSYETDGGGESSNNVYYDSDGNSYSNQDDVYVGGGQNYQPPASTAPTAALYKTEKKIDADELSKSDWGELSNLLKNNGAAESDGDDFAFIQNNTSKKDNGHWIVIAGLICILLSITGFIYLIASKISRRKKIKEGNITKTSDPQRGEPQDALTTIMTTATVQKENPNKNSSRIVVPKEQKPSTVTVMKKPRLITAAAKPPMAVNTAEDTDNSKKSPGISGAFLSRRRQRNPLRFVMVRGLTEMFFFTFKASPDAR